MTYGVHSASSPRDEATPKDLPYELWKRIANNVYNQRDLLSLALVSRSARLPVGEVLYRSVQSAVSADPDTPPTARNQSHPVTAISYHNLLARTLAEGNHDHLIKRFSIRRSPPDHAFRRLLRSLVHLVSSSLQLLHLEVVPSTMIPPILYLPVLQTLSMSTADKVLEMENLNIVRFLPSLVHLSVVNVCLFECFMLDRLFILAPHLKSLRLSICTMNSCDGDDGLHVPYGLGWALSPVASQLEDLILYSNEDSRGPLVHEYGCVACSVGSFSAMGKLRRLGVPLHWLLCDQFAMGNNPVQHNLKLFERDALLPPSLEEIQLQLAIGCMECPYNHDHDHTETMTTTTDEDGVVYFGGLIHCDRHTRCEKPSEEYPELYIFIRALIEKKKTSLPLLRRVVVWNFNNDELNFCGADLSAVFWQHVPAEEELRALGVELLYASSRWMENEQEWPLGNVEGGTDFSF